jgi:hypothetical protein
MTGTLSGTSLLDDFHTSAKMDSAMNLAIHHLFAACRLTAQVGDVERVNASAPLGEFWEEIFQNSLGVVTLSVACIECYANELYFYESSLTPILNRATAATVAELVDKQSIMDKYILALAIRKDKKLDRGSEPVQNADALISLRNAVVHFRPEWFGEQDKHEKLSKKLKDKVVPHDLFANEPIFPRAWASHETCIWALKTTVDFLKYFYERADLQFPLAQFAPRLSQLSANAL